MTILVAVILLLIALCHMRQGPSDVGYIERICLTETVLKNVRLRKPVQYRKGRSTITDKTTLVKILDIAQTHLGNGKDNTGRFARFHPLQFFGPPSLAWAKRFIQKMLLTREHFFEDFAYRGRFERAVAVLVLDDVLARGHEDDCWSDVMHS